MMNEEIVRKLAHGDKEAYEAVGHLPTNLKMAYGLAADELRRKENIVPIDGGMSLYVQQKQSATDNEEVGKALKKRLDDEREREAARQKFAQEHAEKQAKQFADRARALGRFQ